MSLRNELSKALSPGRRQARSGGRRSLESALKDSLQSRLSGGGGGGGSRGSCTLQPRLAKCPLKPQKIIRPKSFCAATQTLVDVKPTIKTEPFDVDVNSQGFKDLITLYEDDLKTVQNLDAYLSEDESEC
jgi:hypothetical protein